MLFLPSSSFYFVFRVFLRRFLNFSFLCVHFHALRFSSDWIKFAGCCLFMEKGFFYHIKVFLLYFLVSNFSDWNMFVMLDGNWIELKMMKRRKILLEKIVIVLEYGIGFFSYEMLRWGKVRLLCMKIFLLN